MAERLAISLRVNGRARELEVAVHHTLLEVLRDEVGLTGTKECCVVGECGACTVLVDGRSVNSCLMLAVEADGTEVRSHTVSDGDEIHVGEIQLEFHAEETTAATGSGERGPS